MAEHEKRAKRYPTDLTDAEWEIVRPFLPAPPKRGRTPSTDLREVLNALRYLARSGGGWRMLPKDFPPWQTVYWWFRRFVSRLLFRTIHDVALMLDREREAREQSPSAAVVDSQSVKAPSAPSGGGFDAGKRIKGPKRHIAVDTDGRLLMVNLTTADISDSAGPQEIVSAVRRRWPWLKHLFGDAAYGLRPSMSGKGNCYDNSAVETFFKSLKAELIWRQNWPTRRQTEAAIFQYINGFYNTRRRHSYLGGISPLAFEAKVA